MENTKLVAIECCEDLQKFGDTDFYLHSDITKQYYKICDGTYDSFNVVKAIPCDFGLGLVQDLFDAYYAGYLYGINRGQSQGRSQLQQDLKALLND